MSSTSPSDWIAITADPLDADELAAWVIRPNCGAVVTFTGIVRDHSDSRADVIALDYETVPELAQQRLHDVADEARRRWPTLERIALHHRTGRVELSVATVVVALSAPHRDVAFDAARYCIDALKASVPMWKREVWEDGSAWSDDAVPLRSARDQ